MQVSACGAGVVEVFQPAVLDCRCTGDMCIYISMLVFVLSSSRVKETIILTRRRQSTDTVALLSQLHLA